MISSRQWWLWAVVMGGWFLVYEIPALKNAYDGDTLSEYVWNLPNWGRWAIIAGLVVLTIHFIRKR